MSKTAHTPAPWKADLGEAFHVKEQDGGRIAMMIFTAGRFGSKGRRNPDEVAANARLIAAAPDLIEALEAFASHYPMGINPMLDDAAVKAHDAIARAKGGA